MSTRPSLDELLRSWQHDPSGQMITERYGSRGDSSLIEG